MNEETMRMKLAYWAGIIKEARTSGMKISDWCDKNQISHRQYYYWHTTYFSFPTAEQDFHW